MRQTLSLIVIALLAVSARGGAQGIKPQPTSIGGHWVFTVTDQGRSVGGYIVDILPSSSSKYAISGQVRVKAPLVIGQKATNWPLSGQFDPDTQSIAFTVTVMSPTGVSRRLFAGVRNEVNSITGAATDADGNLWSWSATRGWIFR
jgi:hypothetical protein